MRNQYKLNSNLFILLILFCATSFNLQGQVEFEEDLKGIESGVGFLLSWSTSFEENNQFFAIERSEDAKNFETVGSVKSHGNTKGGKYQFKDLDLGLKNVTYRLRQVSTDGSHSFSSPITLKKEFVSYFNVVKKEKITEELFQVSVNTIKEGELECRLTNNLGDVIIEELKVLKTGLNDFIFDLSGEIDGSYSLILKIDNELETTQLVKEVKEKKGNVAKKKNDSRGG